MSAGAEALASSPQLAVWVIDSLRRGGAERLALACAATPPPGWRIELIALQPPAAPLASPGGVEAIWGAALDPVGPHWHTLGMRRLADPAEFARLVAWLRRLRPAVVHSHLRHAHIWCAAACRLLRLPQFATLHVMPPPAACAAATPDAGEARLTQLETWALRGAARRIYVSQAQYRAWSRHLPLDTVGSRARTRIIPNGCWSAPAWSSAEIAQWRQRMQLSDGPHLLTVAVVRREKGWRDWLAAAERIATACPSAQFSWVGGGPDAPALAAAVERSPIRARIRLAGDRGDVADWLRGADLFLFPSHGEALPTAVLEAMAQALPVVATDLAATREILGPCGRYAPVANPDALAQASLHWCLGASAASERRAAGVAAQQRWRRNYSPEAWQARLAETYGEVCEQRRRRGRQPGSRRDPPGSRHESPPADAGVPRRLDRILMVEFFDRGGLLHYGWQLADAMARTGAAETHPEVVLLTGRHPEPGIGHGPAHNLFEPRLLPRLWIWDPHRRPRLLPRRWVRAARGLRYVLVWWQVLRVVTAWSPDAVLFGDLEHRCDAWFVHRLRHAAGVGGERGGKPRLADIWHNIEPFERNRPGRLLRHLPWRAGMARDFDLVFVHGATLAAQMRQQLGVMAIAIPHGNQQWVARQEGPDPDLDRRFSLPPGRTLALLFGTLAPYKGIEDMLAALARMPAMRRPLVLIAGLPTAAARPASWRALADRLGVAAWLRWDLRYVPTAEIGWYFRRADFVVLPYRSASQSGVAHLALTFAKPLIVTATGSLSELIDGNGVVVAPFDPDALARALEHLIINRRARLRMGRRSAELAASRHDWDRIAAQVLAAMAGHSPAVEASTP